MAEVKHFIDQSSIQQDADFMKGVLDDVLAKLEKIKAVRVDLKGLGAFGKATDAAKELAKTQEELVRVTDKLAASSQKLERAREAQLRADTQQVKLDEQKAKAAERLQKEQQKLLAQSEKEVKQLEKNNNAYIQLKKNYEAASQASLKRGAELLKEAKGNEAVFKSLLLTDKAYQDNTKEAQRYSQQLLQLESAIGRNQRNVGNYASAYNGLSRQFGLIANELPSLTISVEQFALALSNNLPIAAEELRATSAEIKRLKAEGQAAPSLFSQIGKSILSFQVIISVIVTLLVAFSGELVNMIRNLSGAASATDDAIRAAKQYKAALEAQDATLQSLNTQLDQYLSLLSETNRTRAGGDLDTLRAELQILEEKRFAELEYNKQVRQTNDEIRSQVLALQKAPVRDKNGKQTTGFEDVPEELLNQQKEYEKAVIDSEKRLSDIRFQLQLTTVRINNQKIADEEELNKKIKDLLDKRRDILLEAAEAERKAREQQRNAFLQAELDAERDIVENEDEAYNVRLAAAERFYNLQLALQKVNLQAELNEVETVRAKLQKDLVSTGLSQAQAAVQATALVQERRRAVLVKYQLLEIQAVQENAKKIEEIEIQSARKIEAERIRLRSRQLEAINNAFAIRKSELEKQRDEELIALQEQAVATGMSYEEQKAKELAITTKYNRLILEDELNKVETLAMAEPDPVKRAELLTRAAAIRVALNKMVVDEEIKGIDAIKKKEQELADLRRRLQDELLNLTKTFALGRFDAEKNAIQGNIEALEEKKRKEIEFIDATVTNEVEKAARITNAEKRAQVEKERLELRQRQLDIQRAKWERAFQVAQIAINTARAVAKIQQEAAILIANPLTAAYAPITLSQIPLTIGIGAVQAAAVLAQPIPRFRTGKGQYDKYEGPAWVGDGGKSEMIFRENGSVERTPSTPVLTYVGKNDIIHPDADKLMANAMQKQNGIVASASVASSFDPMAFLLSKKLDAVERAIINKREWYVNVKPDGVSVKTKDGNRWKTYLNNNLQFGK